MCEKELSDLFEQIVARVFLHVTRIINFFSFLLKVVSRCYRLRDYFAMHMRMKNFDKRAWFRVDGSLSCRDIIIDGERWITIVYDFTSGVRCRCQCALHRHALTANHGWQVIATVDTQMPKLRVKPAAHTPVRFVTAGVRRKPCDVQNWP